MSVLVGHSWTRVEQQCAPFIRRRRGPRTPSLVQMEAVECGAAALGIMLRHYGRIEPLENLRVACGVSRDGANAARIVIAAHRYGLTGGGRSMDLADLIKLGHPVIIYWAFQHFMVVEGFRRHGRSLVVDVNDPATGPRTMRLTEFDEGFTGVVLDLQPGPDLEQGGREPRLLEQLRQRLGPTGRGLTLALFASMVLVVPGLVVPLLSRFYIDRAYTSSGWGAIAPMLVGLLLCGIATVVLVSVQLHYLRLVESRLGLTSTTRFMHHLLRLPMGFFLQRQPAELGRRVASNTQVSQLLTREVVVTVANLVLVLVYGVAMLRQDVLLAAISVAVALVNLVVLRLVMRQRVDAAAALQAREASLATTTLHTLSTIETVKASGTEHVAFTRWAGFMARVVSEGQRLGQPTALITVVPPLLATVNTALVVMIGGLRVADGVLSVGLLFAFQTLLGSFSRPLTQLTNQAGRLQAMGAQINRLRDAEDYLPDHSFAGIGQQHTRLTGHLAFERVEYAFSSGGEAWIRDLSFSLDPGMRVALVGASGSGKSTVGRLAAGLAAPSGGQVLVDGAGREEHSRQSLTASISYVDQHVTLFEGSVRQNVSLWDPAIPDDVIVAALADAEILDEVSQRAGGTNALVAEGGRNFSGGQRQRLELARALATQPTLLVLDEATSALDPVTEHAVMDNLRRRGCALLVIAHRLSTVRDADRILVLDHGRVVESGRHHELVEAGGLYANLISSGGTDRVAPPTPQPRHAAGSSTPVALHQHTEGASI